jgi:sugar/nucleoside kinase (ribokinase family)
VVTDGPQGSSVRYTNPTGEAERLQVPAFPRRQPPRDTNRAGESYSATFLSTLLDHGWDAATGVVDDDLIHTAALRASAAAALELDRDIFGFPSDPEIDQAIRTGHVA